MIHGKTRVPFPAVGDTINTRAVQSAVAVDIGYIQEAKRYIDYEQFNDSSKKLDEDGNEVKVRSEQIAAFVGEAGVGKIAHNVFDYPKLDDITFLGKDGNFTDGAINSHLRTAMMRFLMNVISAEEAGIKLDKPDEIELLVGFCDETLKRMALVESAYHMRFAKGSADYETARTEFVKLGKELYGQVDPGTVKAMLLTESKNLDKLTSEDLATKGVQEYLSNLYSRMNLEDGIQEIPLLSDEKMSEIKQVIEARYADILAVVPDDDPNRLFDVNECAEIINKAFKVGGLYDHQWRAKPDEAVSIVDTNSDEKSMKLPENIARKPDELKRLILHELEVHARRGQNGENAGSTLLKRGTAEYGDVEEGLGVLLEIVHAGDFDNPSFHRARDRYIVASLIDGTLTGEPLDADSTFEATWRMLAARKATNGVVTPAIEEAAKNETFKHIENAFRSTSFRDAGTFYPKLIMYYEGLRKNTEWINGVSNINDALDKAMLGKHDHTGNEAAVVQRLVAA